MIGRIQIIRHEVFSVAILLNIGSVGHAETLIKAEIGCLHLKTLERVDQLAEVGEVGAHAALEFMKDQFKSGECSNFEIGTSVRVDKRIKTVACIVPSGSSEPCRWVSSQVIK
jgi:hypothetical protein